MASRSVRVFFNCFSKYLVSCPFPFPCLMMLHSTLTFISHVKHILEESFHHFWPLLLPPWGNILHIYWSSSLSVVVLDSCPDSTHCSALLLIRRGAPPYLWNNLSWESKHYRTHGERESMLWKTQYWSRLRMCSHTYWVKLKCKLFNGVISQSKDWHNHRTDFVSALSISLWWWLLLTTSRLTTPLAWKCSTGLLLWFPWWKWIY